MAEPQIPSFVQMVLLQDKICSAGSLEQADFTALFGYIKAITDDNVELTKILDDASRVLTATTNTVKGEPTGNLVSHSWHDLPEMVVAQKQRMEAAEALIEGMGTEYCGNHALSDRQLRDDDDQPFVDEAHVRDNFANYANVSLEYRRVTDWVPLREQTSETTPNGVLS